MTAPTLAAFLRARWDEEEAVARQAGNGPWRHGTNTDGFWIAVDSGSVVSVMGGIGMRAVGRHMIRHDPARVLADLAAKRKIVERAYELTPHVVVEDCWYTCPSATEDRDGGECSDDLRRGTGCDCGSDIRVGLLLRLLAEPYASHPEFRPEWAL